MGLDLVLLPFDCNLPELAFSHTVLPLERRAELFKEIDKLSRVRGVPVPPGFNSYLSREEITVKSGLVEIEERHYGRTIKDGYDDVLLAVEVSHLLAPPLVYHPGIKDNFKNRAVWAFLRELPADAKIALYWN